MRDLSLQEGRVQSKTTHEDSTKDRQCHSPWIAWLEISVGFVQYVLNKEKETTIAKLTKKMENHLKNSPSRTDVWEFYFHNGFILTVSLLILRRLWLLALAKCPNITKDRDKQEPSNWEWLLPYLYCNIVYFLMIKGWWCQHQISMLTWLIPTSSKLADTFN